MNKLSALTAAFLSSLLFAFSASAGSLTVPKGQAMLVISGKLDSTNVGATAQFDREMLEAMTQVTIRTKTPWYDGTSTFEGVSLAELMNLVGAKGTTVTAIALNDYVTKIPLEDFAKFGAIMALKRDGEYMPVRDKGPLFIVYPYDSNPDLQSQTYYARSAWQLAKLVVD